MATVIRRFAETPATPWRNGRGQTWPLFTETSWRLSVARLDGPAAFSSFPGLHRTFVPWGGGVRLEVDGEELDVRHGGIARFDGDATTRLLALDHPCHAVNLMASESRPTLAVVAAGARLPDAAIAVLCAPIVDAERFDVIRLDAREPLPADSVVVRLDGD